MHKGDQKMKNAAMRSTLIKSTLGQVRCPSYELPDTKNTSHVYGYRLPRDAEGAGEVISSWAQSTASSGSKKQSGSGKNTKTTHAVRNSHANDIVFGIKSKPSESISEVIQARNTNFKHENADYVDLSAMRTKGRLPLPKDTKSSILKDVRRITPSKANQEPFKMTRFKKVPQVLYTQPELRQ